MNTARAKKVSSVGVVLITGGLGGIGLTTTTRLLKDGFRVVANYRNRSDERNLSILKKIVGSYFRNLTIFRADVTKSEEVFKMVEEIKKKFGKLDVVVNNAGVNQETTFQNSSNKDFEEMISGNLMSAIYVTRLALPLLDKSKSPRIIFISSANAFIGSSLRAGYVVAKSGLIGLTRSLAIELAPKFLVNAIVPGYINTQMFRKFRSESTKEKLKRIPLRRIGEPEDVAGAVSFLCSDDTLYITGQSLHINGGLFFS